MSEGLNEWMFYCHFYQTLDFNSWIINVQTTAFQTIELLIWFYYDFLEFPSVKTSKIFTAHQIWRDTNFKRKKCTFFCEHFFFKPWKNWSHRFPWRKSFHQSAQFYKFHWMKRWKIHGQFFLCSCWRFKN